MYIPAAFRETDQAKLFDLIQRHSFGLLVSQQAGRPFATHLPMLLDADAAPNGQIVGHLARGNPQWREMAGQDVLAIFNGPHAYVSPTWYEAEQVVPTWNYVAVHVYGRCELVDDASSVADVLAAYVETYEHDMPSPWKLDRASPYFEQLVRGVVAFRIPIESIEGKWKLGQNHPVERRAKAAAALADCNDADAQAIARLMAETM